MRPQTVKEIAMKSFFNLMKFGMTCGVVMLLLASICSAGAPVQSVRGFGKGPTTDTPLPLLISVNAWLDEDGAAHGAIDLIGGITFVPGLTAPGGPADPWHIEVTDIVFDENTAFVTGVVTHSVFPLDVG